MLRHQAQQGASPGGGSRDPGEEDEKQEGKEAAAGVSTPEAHSRLRQTQHPQHRNIKGVCQSIPEGLRVPATPSSQTCGASPHTSRIVLRRFCSIRYLPWGPSAEVIHNSPLSRRPTSPTLHRPPSSRPCSPTTPREKVLGTAGGAALSECGSRTRRSGTQRFATGSAAVQSGRASPGTGQPAGQQHRSGCLAVSGDGWRVCPKPCPPWSQRTTSLRTPARTATCPSSPGPLPRDSGETSKPSWSRWRNHPFPGPRSWSPSCPAWSCTRS